MGTLVHAPTNNEDNDDWALINAGVVENVIVANKPFIQSIAESYDFLVDLTVGEQFAGVGYTYDDGQDTFSAPPEDFDQELRDASQALVDALATVAVAKSKVDPENVSGEISDADTSGLDEDLSNLWDDIKSFFINGPS